MCVILPLKISNFEVPPHFTVGLAVSYDDLHHPLTQIQNTNKNLYSAKFVDKTRQRRWHTCCCGWNSRFLYRPTVHLHILHTLHLNSLARRTWSILLLFFAVESARTRADVWPQRATAARDEQSIDSFGPWRDALWNSGLAKHRGGSGRHGWGEGVVHRGESMMTKNFGRPRLVKLWCGRWSYQEGICGAYRVRMTEVGYVDHRAPVGRLWRRMLWWVLHSGRLVQVQLKWHQSMIQSTRSVFRLWQRNRRTAKPTPTWAGLSDEWPMQKKHVSTTNLLKLGGIVAHMGFSECFNVNLVVHGLALWQQLLYSCPRKIPQYLFNFLGLI